MRHSRIAMLITSGRPISRSSLSVNQTRTGICHDNLQGAYYFMFIGDRLCLRPNDFDSRSSELHLARHGSHGLCTGPNFHRQETQVLRSKRTI